MKRFLLKLLLFVSIQGGALAGILWIYLQKCSLQKTYHAATIDKHALLQSQARPRMIFVGGSSLAFGLDTTAVAESCGYHPVNMGISIALGLDFMLREVEPDVRRGDIVVVSPEYQLFTERIKGTPEGLWRVIEPRPANLRYLQPREIAEMLDQGLVHRAGDAIRLVLARPSQLFDFNRIAPEEVYQRKSFGPSGDMVAHLGLASSPARPEAFNFSFASNSWRKAIGRLNEFQTACLRKGARAYFSHSPLHEVSFQRRRSALEALEEELRLRLKMRILDAPEEMAFPGDQIFDNYTHLNTAGIARRSRLVATRLKQALERSSQ
jgi:hypothetical protein